ncbi:hypothetical protein ALC56_09077 [Trachymyrmex septentrionalis]|uniref:Uncharacterized protein n=1 Tax=Trachymyrmex septentrionalis TaxID=34720 RepID=A0A151JUQ0_9HYME|nr:hypothetical protein ALC56_09077 [Trachymyrmex septentrionalis]
MTRDHCPDLDKLARRLQHRCQRHLLPNGSSANATENIEKKNPNSYKRNYSASLFIHYEARMRENGKEERRKRESICRRITPYSLSTLPAAIRRHARSVGYVCTTAVFIAVRTRVYAYVYVRTSRLASAPVQRHPEYRM